MSQPAKYQVLERIDAGGMAEVFKANSTSMQGFQKLVAIKRILPELTKKPRFVRMFLDEAKISLHLNHNNCVQIFDLGRAGDTYFIVMEFVDGTDLKHMLTNLQKRRERMPVEQAVYVAIEICKGLAHAHQKCDLEGAPLQIIHRDISPPNILISLEGEVKITDFGLAKAQSQAEVTDPGVVKGKFGYLSPEAADGQVIDQRTDIFAVGILLWEMLCGERLFLGKTDYDTLSLVQRAKYKPVSDYRSDVTPELERIVQTALARDPQERYPDARALAEALSAFLFRYGKPVTSFDIAHHVQNVRQQRTSRPAAQDSGIQDAIQKEINKMTFLEDMDDMDIYLAQHYNSMDSGEISGASTHEGVFEDPSQWGDFGGDDSAPMLGDVSNMGVGGGASEGWQETDIGALTTNSAIFIVPEDGQQPAVLNAFGADADEEDDTLLMSRAEIEQLNPTPSASMIPTLDEQPAPSVLPEAGVFGATGIEIQHGPPASSFGQPQTPASAAHQTFPQQAPEAQKKSSKLLLTFFVVLLILLAVGAVAVVMLNVGSPV